MNNQEPKSRVQRYNFNQGSDPSTRRRQRKPRRWWPWIMTLLTLAIAILLVLAINHHQNSSATSSSASSSNSASVVARSSSVSEQAAYESFKTTYSNYNDNGLTVTQKQKLQSMINDESNSAVQDREQKLLNKAQTKQSVAQSTSSTSSSAQSSNSTFASTHTFSSVADAQSWAQASKEQWLQAGYTTYTITSDGQGNYNLQFVR